MCYTLPWHVFLKNIALVQTAVSAVCVLECQVDEKHKQGQAQRCCWCEHQIFLALWYHNAAGFPFLPVVSVIDTMHCIFLFIPQVKEDSF